MNSEIKRSRLLAHTGPRIPEPLAVHITEYLYELAEILNLREWIIVLNDAEAEGDGKSPVATINSRPGTKFAGLWLSDRFLDRDAAELRGDEFRTQILVHELLHLHFEEAWHFVEDFSDNLPAGGALLSDSFRGRMEIGIDQLAWALVPYMPMFKFPATAKGGGRRK